MFSDFDLDLSSTESGDNKNARTAISPVLTWYTENYCSKTSTHCSPSDMTQCRNIQDPGKGARC